MRKNKLIIDNFKIQWNADSIFIAIAVLYIILPAVIFFLGWLKLPLGLAFSIVFIFFTWKITASISKESNSQVNSKIILSGRSWIFWLTVFFICMFWVYFSGIGSFSFQNSDFWVRNPIFRDLAEQHWPVIYDLSKESAVVKNICGDDKVAFSYYFAWWLPAAAVTKLFGLGELTRNICLYAWAVLGVFLVIYLLCRKIGKCSWIIPIVMLSFSGLDIIVWLLHNRGGEEFDWTNHIEWWAVYFQYSSNTTVLYWVFNQAIPIWIIMSLMLQKKDSSFAAGLGALIFTYSPWATFGIIPFTIAETLGKKKKVKQSLNLLNILVLAIMAYVFIPFYIASSGSSGNVGWIFSFHLAEQGKVLANYLVFILLEFFIYFLIIHNKAKTYEWYWITLVELLLFPLIIVRDANFCMRGSLPALFILCYYLMRYFCEEDWRKIKSRLLCTVLCIGAVTPLCEFNRSLSKTTADNNILQEYVYSFADIKTNNTGLIETVKNQFFVYDYQNSFFFKYLAKN